MKDEQILSVIDNFISNRFYHYALMINGSWGSGKTYFTQNVLIPHLKQNRPDVNYISLYGISTPDEISTKLCERAIRDKITKTTRKNTDGKGAQIATLVIGKFLKFGIRKLDAEEADLTSIVNILPNYDNNVIIFDDLERCQCNICSVLGYINDFVEHSDSSVIIIANEEEIGKGNQEENQELQMLVALNERLYAKLPPNSFYEVFEEKRGEHKEAPKPFLTPEEVHRTRKIIFQSGNQYRRTKEKVIGLTLDYDPDLKSIFTKLIKEKIQIEELKGILLKTVDTFVRIAENTKHCNIRTFLFCLEKMKQIHDVIDKKTYPVIQMVAKYCFRSSISRMMGEKPPEWNDKEFGIQSFGMGFSQDDTLYGFKFIDDLITGNSIDVKKVSEILSNYCEIENARGSLENDPYQQLKVWYEKSDQEMEAILQEINSNIKGGKYSTRIFPDIVHYLIWFKRHELLTELCDQIVDSMLNFIKNAPKERLEPFAEEYYILEDEDLKNYEEILKKLSSCVEELSGQTEESYWKKCIKKVNWSDELLSGVKERKGGRHSFVFWIEPVEIYDLIKKSNNKQIYTFREALHETYYRGYYYSTEIDDLPHLYELDKLLTKTDEMEKIQTAHCEWIRNDLQKLIEKFSARKETYESTVQFEKKGM